MKKLLSAVIFILAMICLPSGAGQVFAASNEDFVIEGGMLRSYKGDDDSVVIPRSVSVIGPDVFTGKKLSTLTVPSSVKVIGSRAFYGCPSLARVTLEEGLKVIGMSAFADCRKLYMINIPSSVTDIQPGIFAGDISLSNLSLSPLNTSYFFNDGVLYTKDSSRLVQYLPGRKSTSYSLPFTVKKIDRYAFWGATLLTGVRLSNNVEEIPAHAFSNCIGLTTIYLPESVRNIRAYAFSDCVNLYYVAMERDDVVIHSTAFDGCSKGLSTENGISEGSAAQKSKEKKDKAEKEEKKEDKDDKDGTSVSSDESDKSGSSSSKESASGNKAKKKKKSSSSTAWAGRVTKGSSGYRYIRVPDRPQNGSSSKKDNGLIGSTRISGGHAFVIPEKK